MIKDDYKCLNVNCPEARGLKCWLNEPISVINNILIDKEIKTFMKSVDYKLSVEFEDLFNEKKSKIYAKF